MNTSFSIDPSEARNIDRSAVLNNSSRIIILEYSSVKILYAGDIQTNGWHKLLSDTSFVTAASNPSIVVAPHHGHSSSFCSELYDTLGKPFLNICSLAKNDPNISSQYSCDGASRGCEIIGEHRWMLSTRSDGTIIITIYQDRWFIDCQRLRLNDF